jgi:uncharacterized HhH-GPD family protein
MIALHLSQDEAADALLSRDPLALLLGMLLDQQIPMEKAFRGPYVLQERLAAPLDATAVAHADDLAEVFARTPAIHRFPGSMAKRVRDLAAHLLERYDGDAARVWTDAGTPQELEANLAALPGFGEMKVKTLAAILAKHFGVAMAEPLVPAHPTLGDVDSAQALADYQAGKRAQKAAMRAAKAEA